MGLGVRYTLPNGGGAVDALLLHEAGERRTANLVYCPPGGVVGAYGASYEVAVDVPHADHAADDAKGSWQECAS